MKIAGWEAPIYNISGLAFSRDEVRARVPGDLKPFKQRALRVGFAARWDQEKQPDFYMDFIEEWTKRNPHLGVEFCVFSGAKLKSNNDSYMNRTRDMQQRGLLTLHEDLEKNDYYALLNDTRVLFNCALQDWVSNTVSEADTLGCNVLYPAYRSFPETFANDHTRLYVPWSIDDAINKLYPLLDNPSPNMGRISAWTDGTIDRIVDILEGTSNNRHKRWEHNRWARNGVDYRKYTHESKY
jgi:hypothetical protein